MTMQPLQQQHCCRIAGLRQAVYSTEGMEPPVAVIYRSNRVTAGLFSADARKLRNTGTEPGFNNFYCTTEATFCSYLTKMLK
jgi:hypothetical protein